MNDRYLFRGKYIDFDEDTETEVAKWCSGGLIFDGEKPVILDGVYEMNEEYCTPEFWYTVEPETVGQCTGLHDKNGKLIFEGDIIQYVYSTINIKGEVCFGEYKENKYGLARHYGFYIKWNGTKDEYQNDFLLWVHRVNVIGNIHDTPELLEEEK